MLGVRESGWILKGLAAQSGGLSIALSLAFFLSNPNRVSAQAYNYVISVGGPRIWGVVFLFVGALVIGSSWRGPKALRIALAASGLAYMFLALSFAVAAVVYSTANLTAPVVYGYLAYAHLFVCALITYKIHHPHPRVDDDDD